MVIVFGPLHFGKLVAAGDGNGVAVRADLAGNMDVPDKLGVEFCSVEIGGTVGVVDIDLVSGTYPAISRLGPRGAFHLKNTIKDKANPPKAMISTTHRTIFGLCIFYNSI